MKTVIILFLFLGMFFIIQGVFDERVKAIEENKKTVYKFIPRTYYEEQMGDSDLSSKVAPMFNKESPWFDRAIGEHPDIKHE